MSNDDIQWRQTRDVQELNTPVLIRGGYHVKDLPGGRCMDVMQQLYNWRLVISNTSFDHGATSGYLHGWCYFGHGTDAQGNPRDMSMALHRALSAAMVWDGEGTPPNYDKEAF